MFKVMIVEDDMIAANYLKKIIETIKEYKVLFFARSYKEAINYLQKEYIDIIFIDIMLIGKKNGIDLAKTIKKEYPNSFFIFLTAYSNQEFLQDAAKTDALNYLLKPYRPQEIEAALILAKNHLNKNNSHILQLVDNYSFDFSTNRLYKNNKEITLSSNELKLIFFLAKNSQIILSKEAILNFLEINEESLRSLIYRIRNLTSKELILTFKGIGYKLNSIGNLDAI